MQLFRMQLFRMHAMKYSTSPLYFLGFNRSLMRVCIGRQAISEIFHGITGEGCITILYHDIDNTVTNSINGTHARRMMGTLDEIPSNMQQLSCILIGCIFYGVA